MILQTPSPAPGAAPAADRSPARAVSLAGAARRLAAAGRGRAALAAAQGIDLPRLRGAILAALGPQLPDDLLETAVTQARGLADAWARGTALAGLLPRLPPSHRPFVVADVLAAAQALDWLEGDVVLRDAARVLAAAGDAASARRVSAGIRDAGLRRAAQATLAAAAPANGRSGAYRRPERGFGRPMLTYRCPPRGGTSAAYGERAGSSPPLLAGDAPPMRTGPA